MLFIKQYWKLIVVLVLLLGSNYLTKTYVSRGYENQITGLNVEALKQQLTEQQEELSKQQKLIKEKSENEQYYTKENEKLNDAFSTLSDEFSLLSETLDSLSEGGQTSDTRVNHERASNSTTRLVQAELQRFTLRRAVELSQAVDQLQLSNQICVREYNSVKEIVNGK
jgi:hypothetical protein